MPNTFEIIGAMLVIIACAMSVLEEVYNHYKSKQISYEPVSVASDIEVTSEDPEP